MSIVISNEMPNIHLKDLESLWSPLLTFYKIFGLYHYTRSVFGTKSFSSSHKLLKVYSCCMIAFCVAGGIFQSIRYHFKYNLNSVTMGCTLDDISEFIWSFVVVSDVTSLFLISHQPKKLQLLYKLWSTLKFNSLNSRVIESKIRSQTWLIIIIIAAVLILGHIGKYIYFLIKLIIHLL